MTFRAVHVLALLSVLVCGLPSRSLAAAGKEEKTIETGLPCDALVTAPILDDLPVFLESLTALRSTSRQIQGLAMQDGHKAPLLTYLPTLKDAQMTAELLLADAGRWLPITETPRTLEDFQTAHDAHDLRNLFARSQAAIQVLDFLARQPDGTEIGQRAELNLASIVQVCADARQLVDYMKVPHEIREPKLRMVTVEEVYTPLKTLVAELEVEVTVEQPKENLEIYADPMLLRRALLNTILNAKNAILAKKPDGKITVSAFRDPDTLETVLMVEDTGPGIAPQNLAKIFEDGFSTEGTPGKGMSSTKRMLELHGARMDVDSTVGKGTRITMRMPTPPVVDPGPVVQSPVARRQKDDSSAIRPGSILLIDDNEDMVTSMSYLLQALGQPTVGVVDAGSALGLLRSHPEKFEVIFLDRTGIKDENGREVTPRDMIAMIREIYAPLPIPVPPVYQLTGYGSATDAVPMGITGNLIKPVEHTTILDLVKKHRAESAAKPSEGQ